MVIRQQLKNFDPVLQFAPRILLIFLFFLSQFFRKNTFAIAMQHWLIPVLTKFRGDIRLVSIKPKYSERLVKGLGKKRQKQ